MEDTTVSDVLVRVQGRLGHITLNRPRAINALTMEMIHTVNEALEQWRTTDEVESILIDGAGERGLCAGGDIKLFLASMEAGDERAATFWRDEYVMDYAVASHPLPVVTFMDGVTMGGGIGIAAHASHRVVTARSVLAMPEVRIGMAPDVGGTLLLSRMPGRLGEHYALTGASLHGAQAVNAGLADYLVAEEDLPALADALQHAPAGEALTRFVQPVPETDLRASMPWVDECYAADDLEDIVDCLARHDDPAAREAAMTLRGSSPLALAVTLEALRRARRLDNLAEVLRQDLRVMARFDRSHDTMHGIHARVIDRSHEPVWQPATLAEVTAEMVERHFAPLPDDLDLPGSQQ